MLKSRRTFPPGGFRFFEPKTNWPKNHISYFSGKTFDQVVEEVVRHRLANPRFANTWNTDFESVANEVDQFTCVDCGMDENYCTPGVQSFPFGPAPQPPRLGVVGAVAAGGRKVATGIAVLLDWLGAGGKAVKPELSEARAAICADCPANQPGDWVSFFTGPAIEQLQKQLAIKNDMRLKTSLDDKLNVCKGCWCFMRLKVHTPLQHIVAHLKPEGRAELDPRCWITKEESHGPDQLNGYVEKLP